MLPRDFFRRNNLPRHPRESGGPEQAMNERLWIPRGNDD
jgi:hypothetical protein